ncbi:MAG TPA: hypothetical protein VM695_11360 [Phycisphaerae bacterium]|nr:hypothetical protein [Phycisphaerae bacterium]
MRTRRMRLLAAAALATALTTAQASLAAPEKDIDRWVTATGRAAGADDKARDEAIAQALRTAVEEACGVFLTSQSKTEDYKAVYDKVLANAVGYVRQHKVDQVTVEQGVTVVKVRARVSTRKFEEDWAGIRHTVHQENNPRVVVAVVESVHHGTGGESFKVQEGGTVQARLEDFLLSKGIVLMDRQTASKTLKRDILLAAVKDDTDAVASLGARFSADVVVTGQATAKFGKAIKVADQTLYQYTAGMNVRVVQTDSARILTSKSFGPVTTNTLQRGGGEDKALAKLVDESAPKLLEAVVQAWRQRANVSRTVQLSVSGMDFALWKAFRKEATDLRGVQALRLREITQAVASIDVEYRYNNETLADRLTELKTVKLKVVEVSPNRLKLKVAE